VFVNVFGPHAQKQFLGWQRILLTEIGVQTVSQGVKE